MCLRRVVKVFDPDRLRIRAGRLYYLHVICINRCVVQFGADDGIFVIETVCVIILIYNVYVFML